ncbi:MAG: MFS transporter [Dehalococcoidia bacterium]
MTLPHASQLAPFRTRRNIRLLYALGIFTMAQPGLAVWVVYLLDFRHLTLTQVGVMDAFYWGVKLLMEVPSGAVADRFGRRASFALGLLMEGSGVLLFAFASNFPLLLLSYVLWSSGFSFRSGNDQAYLYDALSADGRGAEFSARAGLLNALTTASFMTAGIAGGWIAQVTSLQIVMLIGALPYLLGGVTLAMMQEPPRVVGAEGHLPYAQTLRAAASVLRHNALVRYAILAHIAVQTGFVMNILLAQPFLRAHGVDLALFGVLQAPASLAGALAAIASARASRLLGVRPLASVGIAGIVGGLLLLAIVDRLWAFAGFVLVQAAIGVTMPAVDGYVNDRTESNIRATIMSVVPLGTAITFVFVSPLAGITGDISLRLAFGALAALILVPGVAALLAWRAAERAAPPGEAAR